MNNKFVYRIGNNNKNYLPCWREPGIGSYQRENFGLKVHTLFLLYQFFNIIIIIILPAPPICPRLRRSK